MTCTFGIKDPYQPNKWRCFYHIYNS